MKTQVEDNGTNVNVYQCEFGCLTTTIDIEKGVTPFMIKCRRKPTRDRPIAKKFLGKDGECIGLAKSWCYPKERPIPKYIPEITHEWYRFIPKNFHELSFEGRKRVGEAPLELREIIKGESK